jgi:hypothetical protein
MYDLNHVLTVDGLSADGLTVLSLDTVNGHSIHVLTFDPLIV